MSKFGRKAIGSMAAIFIVSVLGMCMLSNEEISSDGGHRTSEERTIENYEKEELAAWIKHGEADMGIVIEAVQALVQYQNELVNLVEEDRPTAVLDQIVSLGKL